MKSAQGEYAARGKGKTFEVLKGFLQGVSAGLASYQEAATTLGISEAVVNTLIYRLRKRYSIALRREVARTVSEPAAIDDEISSALRGAGRSRGLLGAMNPTEDEKERADREPWQQGSVCLIWNPRCLLTIQF